jgi:hypothetical protein
MDKTGFGSQQNTGYLHSYAGQSGVFSLHRRCLLLGEPCTQNGYQGVFQTTIPHFTGLNPGFPEKKLTRSQWGRGTYALKRPK